MRGRGDGTTGHGGGGGGWGGSAGEARQQLDDDGLAEGKGGWWTGQQGSKLSARPWVVVEEAGIFVCVCQ